MPHRQRAEEKDSGGCGQRHASGWPCRRNGRKRGNGQSKGHRAGFRSIGRVRAGARAWERLRACVERLWPCGACGGEITRFARVATSRAERLRASAPARCQSRRYGRDRARVQGGRAGGRVRAVDGWRAARAGPVGAMTPTHGAHIGERHGESASGADRGSSATLPAPRAPPRRLALAGIVKGDGGGGRESPIRPHPYFCFRFRFSFCVGWVWREELLSQCFHGVD